MGRPNLQVLMHTQARRILLEGRRAIGVEVQAEKGIRRLRARKEIVLCAGAFHTPHILLHSGIGDERSLRSWGVAPLHHLPGVGRFLQDHPAASVVMDTRDVTSYGLSWRALPRNILECCQYVLKRSGPLASNLFETNAYIRTLRGLDRPDRSGRRPGS